MRKLIDQTSLEDRLRKNLENRLLPDSFLYVGQNGAENWLELDASSGFTVAARLTTLLKDSLASLTHYLPKPLSYVSLGVGSGEKERMVLSAVGPESISSYIPVDISEPMVVNAADVVSDMNLRVDGIVGLLEDLPNCAADWERPMVLAVTGNTFCNYHPDQIFPIIRSMVSPEDRFLVDFHLFDDSEDPDTVRTSIEQAYRSDENVRFNLGPLMSRGVPAEACEFHLDLVPVGNLSETVYRTNKTIAIRRRCTAVFDDSTIEFSAGDTIRLGFTYKYTANQILDIFDHYGFQIYAVYHDRPHTNMLVLAGSQSTKEDLK